MSDTNYMNAYVNLVMETVHGNLNDILQLKTQTKLLNDLVLEKDQVISSLTTELETARTNQSDNEVLQAEMQKLRDNAATWETQYNNMASKVSHMDTLANQFNDIQKQLLEKDEEAGRITEVLRETRQRLMDSETLVKLQQEKIDKLTQDLELANKKVERLTKKEEKKADSVPTKTVAFVPPKVDINKEETKSTPITLKTKVIDKPKETDDDF